jgi:predicted nucleotidyltransferase
MAKIPKDPKEIFREITEDYNALFGDDLVSIMLYGSAAGPDYRPGKSDVNLMIVLTEKGIRDLEKAFKAVARWRKRKVATPLFLTEDYVANSIDVYPIEYLNIQRRYLPVYGKDVLRDLTFKPEFLRLQCEREIKGKLLLLRRAFLETSGRGADLRALIRDSIGAFEAMFRALLHLKGKDAPLERREVIRSACKAFDLDAPLFERLLDIREERITLRDEELKGLFQEYLKEVRKLSEQVDTLGG